MADNPGFIHDEGAIDPDASKSNVEQNLAPDQVEVDVEHDGTAKAMEAGAEPVMDLPATKPYAGMGKDDLLRFSETPFWSRFRLICVIIFWLGWLALLGAVIGLTIVAPRCKDPPEPAWWQKSAFYQIYVRSFYDNNNDGIGDLQGVTNRLDYIRNLNVDAIILSSVFPSDDIVDHNQEITNHTAIDPVYGTMEDFENLLKEAHDKGLKVILEFIPNHTGERHAWFTKSRESSGPGNEFWNYYVWADCSPSSLPNNWRSVSDESAWTRDLTRSQCFLHQLSGSQPDLNLRSGRVKAELDSILLFWLDKGVDGFRISHAQLLYEDADLRNDTRLCDEETYDCLEHVHSSNQPETHDLVAHWRALLNEYSDKTSQDRILITDAFTTINETLKYYGTLGRIGAHLPMNYNLREFDQGENEDSRVVDEPGRLIYDLVQQWMSALPTNETANWALSSQDRLRLTLSDNDDDLMLRAIYILQMTLPGVPISYYGEEIGMRNGQFNESTVLQYRTPMQWDNSEYGGFSNVSEKLENPTAPWNPVNDDYETINVQAMSNDTNELNIFNIFRTLTMLRHDQEALQFGAFEEALVTDHVFSFVREHEGHDRILVVANLGDAPMTENLADSLDLIPKSAEVILSSHPDSTLVVGDDKSLKEVSLKPFEAAIFSWEYSR